MSPTIVRAPYEELVDRLLDSPAYGERWGRHWLDVVRFGESNGYEQNHLRNSAWPYRDWVIRSLNEDKPFNRMIVEQLAGDQIAPGDPGRSRPRPGSWSRVRTIRLASKTPRAKPRSARTTSTT
ncbi:MAG: DUF1549 domain-containing protein [Bryobacterales bacterium]